MKVVGLTGGIGTGKSTVAKLFEVMGVPVYNSDHRAKVMYFLPEVKAKVVELLGPEAYKSDTEINREVISKTRERSASLRPFFIEEVAGRIVLGWPTPTKFDRAPRGPVENSSRTSCLKAAAPVSST